jgi:hypothetical protein
MRAVDERRARLVLRASLAASLVLTLLSVAGAMNWITVKRGQYLALGIALALIALGSWLSSRWLSKRGLPL